jgi:hypothetical protein
MKRETALKKKTGDIRLSRVPATLAELEAQLLQSVERLDRGEGVDGKEVFRRLHRKIIQSRKGT